jgi:hypothetical protein
MTESASGPGADLHKALVAFDLEPAFSLGEVVFYNTKNFFKKHNFGRDVKRFVHQVPLSPLATAMRGDVVMLERLVHLQ